MSDERERDPRQWSPFHDRRGVPICAGDLIKSYHFTDFRRKKHYLYHVAVHEDGYWQMVKVNGGGKCRMSQSILVGGAAEVISGHGPGDFLDYNDRPRVAKEES